MIGQKYFSTSQEFKHWCEGQGMKVVHAREFKVRKVLRAYFCMPFGKNRATFAEYTKGGQIVRLYKMEPPEVRNTFARSRRVSHLVAKDVETVVDIIKLED